ncbi:MAG: hypothetical protein HOP11_00070 [Saprospiraceae bacterium]|nr:hypothetical protein [Saprospiraceae bacterium]
MKAFGVSFLIFLGFYALALPYRSLNVDSYTFEKIPCETLKDTLKKDTSNPYNFHLYIVLRKKHYHALLTVKDTMDKILLTKEIDSLRVGRNFFNIPTKKKLPSIVKWELKAGDFQKKGKMAIH